MSGNCSSSVPHCDGSETLDLSLASDCIQQMVLGRVNSFEISSSLRDIVIQFGKDDQRPTKTYLVDQSCYEQSSESLDRNADFKMMPLEIVDHGNLIMMTKLVRWMRVITIRMQISHLSKELLTC